MYYMALAKTVDVEILARQVPRTLHGHTCHPRTALSAFNIGTTEMRTTLMVDSAN
jgi:hypothetical protein